MSSYSFPTSVGRVSESQHKSCLSFALHVSAAASSNQQLTCFQSPTSFEFRNIATSSPLPVDPNDRSSASRSVGAARLSHKFLQSRSPSIAPKLGGRRRSRSTEDKQTTSNNESIARRGAGRNQLETSAPSLTSFASSLSASWPSSCVSPRTASFATPTTPVRRVFPCAASPSQRAVKDIFYIAVCRREPPPLRSPRRDSSKSKSLLAGSFLAESQQRQRTEHQSDDEKQPQRDEDRVEKDIRCEDAGELLKEKPLQADGDGITRDSFFYAVASARTDELDSSRWNLHEGGNQHFFKLDLFDTLEQIEEEEEEEGAGNDESSAGMSDGLFDGADHELDSSKPHCDDDENEGDANEIFNDKFVFQGCVIEWCSPTPDPADDGHDEHAGRVDVASLSGCCPLTKSGFGRSEPVRDDEDESDEESPFPRTPVGMVSKRKHRVKNPSRYVKSLKV